MKRKAIVFILDGLGDRPCPDLDGQTPLQAAVTPTLDSLAADGQCGLVDPIAPGVRVETHTGVSALMGLSPQDALSIARGPVEGAGVGVQIRPGDVVLRFNFSTVDFCEEDDAFILKDRRAERIDSGTDALCDALNAITNSDMEPSIRVYPATHHRGVLVIRGMSLPEEISSNDLGSKGVGQRVPPIHASVTQHDASPSTSDAMNEFLARAHDVLNQHPVNLKRLQDGKAPANFLLLRGAGRYQQYDNLLNQVGLRVAVIAGERTVLGLAKLFGFSSISDPRFTADYDTDLSAKLEACKQALLEHDIVYLHVKATDIAAHDRLPRVKADFISSFDLALAKFDFSQVVVAVCADHSTDCARGEHNADPVPVILNYSNSRKDAVTKYDEDTCINGMIGRIPAQHFIFSLVDAMDRMVGYELNFLRE